MNRANKRRSPCCDCAPIHVTEWVDVYADGGVIYAVFMSGNTQHAVAMGPAKALEAIEMAKRAMIQGNVLPMLPPHAH